MISNYKVITTSGRHLIDISHAHIVSLKYKLITSARHTDDLSIGFDRDRNRRQRALTNNKNLKGKHHVRIMLKNVFGFAEHQEKGTYDLGYKVTLTRISDNSVLNRNKAISIEKIKIIAIEWYALHYAPSVPQQTISSKQILSISPIE